MKPNEKLLNFLHRDASPNFKGVKLSEYSVEIEKNTQSISFLSQYIFFLEPISKGELNNRLIDKTNHHLYTPRENEVKFSIKKRCHCNPKLTLIEGDIHTSANIYQFLHNSNNSGSFYIELEGYYYQILEAQPNIIISVPDGDDAPPPLPKNQANDDREAYRDAYVTLTEEFLRKAKLHNDNSPNSPVVVIMDSGIDLEFFENDIFPLIYYTNQCGLHSNECNICSKDMKGYSFGWSFIDEDLFRQTPNNPYDDDGRHKHGTRIAKIIANMTSNNVRIMPLKTANYEGIHTFFDIYCAFEYILSYNRQATDNNKVRLINASWGFYSVQELTIFSQYISQLKNENIILVSAAGNDKIEIGEAGNLFSNYYPAIYSTNENDNNVFTITTVKKLDTGRYEVMESNSERYVDAGVISYKDDEFKDPLRHTDIPRISGSSYATAFYTGYLANQMSINPNISLANLREGDIQANVVYGVRGTNNNNGNFIINPS